MFHPEIETDEGVSERAAKLCGRLYIQARNDPDYALAIVGAAAGLTASDALARGVKDAQEASEFFCERVADNLEMNRHLTWGRA